MRARHCQKKFYSPSPVSYLTFHLVFIVPPILALTALQRRPLASVGGRRAMGNLSLLCLIAFVYTTPWDNYLVYRGVWWYGPERVLGTIGYVPLEEYLFFILQPVLTGLFLYLLLGRAAPPPAALSGLRSLHVQAAGALFYLAVSLAGGALLLFGPEATLYLGLILAWAGPVLAGLWAYGGDTIWHLRRFFFPAVLLPTLYLWMADRSAIALGIWDISDAYSLGLDPLGLPVEEATFFLVTNLLVVQGLLLFLFKGDAAPAPGRAARRAARPSAQ